jgi:non-specific serine/threonine protein kinase
LLETVRQYFQAKLAETTEEVDVKDKHLDWYLHLAEAGGGQHLRQAALLDLLEVEQDNLRAALGWSLTHDVERGLRLAASIWGVWLMRGYAAEGRYWTEALLARARSPSLAGAHVCYQLSLLAMDLGDFSASRSRAEQALAWCRELGDELGIGWSLLILGHLERYVGEDRHANELYTESAESLLRVKDDVGACLALGGQGSIAMQAGTFALARERLQEALNLARACDDANGVGWVLFNLGALADAEGDPIRATHFVQDSLASFQKLASKGGMGAALGFLGYLMACAGQVDRGRDLIRESLLLLRAIGHRPRLIWDLIYLGDLQIRNGAVIAGIRLIAAAEAANPNWRFCFEPSITTRVAAALEIAESQLGHDRFAAAWLEGQSLTLEQATAAALEESTE